MNNKYTTKYAILSIVIIFFSFNCMAQIRQKKTLPTDLNTIINNCTSKKTLNISTGIDAIGNILPINSVDPYWIGYGAITMGSVLPQYNWNVISGAGIIRPNQIITPNPCSQSTGVTYQFKREFYVCSKGTIQINGVFRVDNKMVSLELLNNANNVVWTSLPPVSPPLCESYNDFPFTGNINVTTGTYTLKFVYWSDQCDKLASEIRDGFSMRAAITSSAAILANNSECCNSKNLENPISISTTVNPRVIITEQECNCGNWETKKITYSDANNDIICNGLLTLIKNTSAIFNLKYNCSNANCTTKYEAVVSTPSGQTTTIQITNNQNWNYVFNQIGNYTMTFKTYCNDVLCPNSCTYNITVK